MSLIDFLRGRGRSLRGQASRKSPRFPVNTDVVLSLNNGTRLLGTLRDMSTGGGFILSRDRPVGLRAGEVGSFRPADAGEGAEGGELFHCKVVRIEKKGVAIRTLSAEEVTVDGLSSEDFYPEDFME